MRKAMDSTREHSEKSDDRIITSYDDDFMSIIQTHESEMMRRIKSKMKQIRPPKSFDATDVWQESITSILEAVRDKRCTFRGSAHNLKLWLIQVIYNQFKRLLTYETASNRSKQGKPDISLVEQTYDTPDNTVQERRKLEELQQAVNTSIQHYSSVKQRVIRAYVEGFSQKEIAGQAGIADRTVRRYLVQWRNKFQKTLNE